MHINSPYANIDRPWLKGALHVHTNCSDGSESPQRVVDDYQRHGYDFLALTDHGQSCLAPELPHVPDFVVLAGCEARADNHSELGIIGLPHGHVLPTAAAPRDLVAAGLEAGAFVILNHPNWHIDHWSARHVLELDQAHAIEIYNAVGEALPGPAEACDKWDRQLSAGIRTFGVAADDAHEPEQRNRAWVMVAADKTPEHILAALKAGRFYASTGPVIDGIQVEGDRLCVSASGAEEIRLYADRGALRHRTAEHTTTYQLKADDSYIRVEVIGRAATKAWSQPIWIETPESRKLREEFRAWSLAQLN